MSQRPLISMIGAVARNGIVGRNNQMPWRLPADMAFFKKTTMGHPVVMGRNTFESIGGKPLPGRHNIVLTRDRSYRAEGSSVVHTPEEAAALVDGPHMFVIGGSEVYKLFLPMADRLILTHIDDDFEGDTYFPELNMDEWKIVSREPGVLDEKNKHPHTFVIYERNRGESDDQRLHE